MLLQIARRILFSPEGRVWLFFDEYVHLPNFDVASDAFTTLKCGPTTARHERAS